MEPISATYHAWYHHIRDVYHVNPREAVRRSPAVVVLIAMLLACAALILSDITLPGSPAAASSAGMKMPFASGSTWVVSQGYNTSPKEGGDHYNCDPATLKDSISQSEKCNAPWQYKYSLDLVRADGQTAGQQVLSPVNGTITWIDLSTGGLSINLGDGYAFALFHVNLEPSLAAGQTLSVGQVLGTVAPAGVANTGNTPHLHITLWKTTDGGNWSRTATPFSGSLAIDGYSFADLGSAHEQHRGTTVSSSNAVKTSTATGAPDVPTLKSPTDGTKLTNSDVTFSWNTTSRATEYQVVINDTIYGPWTTATTWTYKGLDDGSYFWRVRARNSSGIGLLSASRRFTLAEPVTATPPAAGSLGITPSVTSGQVGTSLTVSGTGFTKNESVTLRWDSTSATALTTVTANANGSFIVTIAIPESIAGKHTLYAIGASSKKQTTATISVSPSLSRAPVEGAAGTKITITVKGFGKSEDVRLNWRTTTGPVLGTVRTNANGTGTITIALPSGAPGWNDYTGVGLTSGVRAYGAINVLTNVTVSPTTAAKGDKVTVKATGFTPSTKATVTFNGSTTVCTGTTAADGSLTCTFTVPNANAGAYAVKVTTGNVTATATLAVSGPPAVTTAPTTGAPGTGVTVSIGGFRPNEKVNVVWGSGSTWKTVTADANGVATVKATVPQVTTGKQTVKATGVTSNSTATTTFSVAATATAGSTSMTGKGTYVVTATREGLVGGTTASGHVILENDYFVSLPNCTTTSCPWGQFDEGQKTNCGTNCYVMVTNPATGQCRVEPIYDVGPWFTVDDWWNTTSGRYLNSLDNNSNILAQGYTGADAARDGLDVGYGTGTGGIGSSNKYSVVGNRSAIDLADGTWTSIGLPFAQGLANNIEVQLLWQTGANASTAAQSCGHALNQAGGADLSLPTATSNPSFSGAKLTAISSTSSGASTVESARARDGSTSTSWYTTSANPSSATITIDYGAVTQLTGVKWNFRLAGGSDEFLVQTSENGSSWRTVGTYRGGNTGSWYGIDLNRQGRYLRITFKNPTNAASLGYLAEVQLWGSKTTTPAYATGTANISFSGAKLTATGSYSGGNATVESVRARDGSTLTSWYTTSSNPTKAAITIDYGSVTQLTGVKWVFRAANGADEFLVQTSSDGSTWSTVGTFRGGTLGTWYGNQLNRQGRYVKFTFTNPAGRDTLGYLAEVQLWGASASGADLSLPTGTANMSFSGSALTATGSYSGGATTVASLRARDGSTATSWYTTSSNPTKAAVTIDYGTEMQLTGVKWNFRLPGGANEFLIQTSSDGSTWSNVGTFRGGTSGTWYGIDLKRTGRYVKFLFTNPTNAPTLGYLSEVQLWGTPIAIAGSNPTFSGSQLKIVSSTTSSGTTPSTRAHDGTTSTSWYTTGSSPVSAVLTLDLGSVQQLSGVKWTYRLTGGADRMILTVSEDGTTWTQLVIMSNRQPLTWEGWATTAKARYVRMTFQNPNNVGVLGYVAEVQVWGSGAVSAASFSAAMAAPATPVAGTPVAATPVAGTPTAATPIAGTPTAATPVAATPVAGTPTAATPVPVTEDATPIASVPSDATPAATMTIPATPVAEETIPATPIIDEPVVEETIPATPVSEETVPATPTIDEPIMEETIPATPVSEETVPATPIIDEPVVEEIETPTVESVVTIGGFIANTDGDGAFCRTLPTTDGDAIALLPDGTAITLIGEPVDGWQQVTCDGVDGYVYADFVSTEAPVAAEPSPTAEPTIEATPDQEIVEEPTPTLTEELPTEAPIATETTEVIPTAEATPDDSAPVEELPTEAPVQDLPTEEPVVEENPSPTVEPTPTIEPTLPPTPTPEPSPTFEPTPTPTPEPVLVTNELVIPVASDTSVTTTDPDLPQTGEDGVALTIGGEKNASAVLTFNVEGVASGTVVNARLVLTGTGANAGDSGRLLIAPGVWFDEYGVTQSQIAATSLWDGGSIGWIDPGVETSIDVTGIVTADGTVSFVITGSSEQLLAITSRESGAPAYLVIATEEWVIPETTP